MIGVGFGGSVAARLCTQAGLSVLLLGRGAEAGDKIISGLTIPFFGFLFGPDFVHNQGRVAGVARDQGERLRAKILLNAEGQAMKRTNKHIPGAEWISDAGRFVSIEASRCTGCGDCIKACFGECFEIREGKARVKSLSACMECA